MFADYLDNKLKNHGIHYGWVMISLAFITTLFSSAIMSVPQVLIIPITKEFGWNISDISTPIAIMFVILALIAPFGGALILKFGVTKVVTISFIFSIIGILSTTFIFEKWHLIGTIGICLGISSGMLGLGLGATIATRWFNVKRGLVMGLLASSFAAGQLTFVPLMAWLTTIYDWRIAILPVLLGAGVSIFLFILFGKNWPSDLNMPPYGDKEIFIPPPLSKQNAFFLSISAVVTASKQTTFWIPFCADNNIGIVVASSYLALMGIFNFIGTTGSGWLSDRYDNFKLLAIYYGLRGISLIYLPYSNLDVYALTLWAIFFGLDFIATVPPTVRLTGKFFGTVNGPIIFGWIFAAHQLGNAFAAYGAGVIRDSVLTYLPAFLTAGLFCFVASTLILFLRKKSYQ
jgi:predicted MFS family arabinose efflux permease